MREHRHRNLLKQIVDLITQNTDTTTLYKVRAHTGIEGNEKADAMAKQVALGASPPNIRRDIPESNLRKYAHWAAHTPESTATHPHPKPQPLNTLDSNLRTILHQQHKLGMADTTTLCRAGLHDG